MKIVKLVTVSLAIALTSIGFAGTSTKTTTVMVDVIFQIKNADICGEFSGVIPAAWRSSYQWELFVSGISSWSPLYETSIEKSVRIYMDPDKEGQVQVRYTDAFNQQIISEVFLIDSTGKNPIYFIKRNWNVVRFIDEDGTLWQPDSVHYSSAASLSETNECPGDYCTGYRFPIYDKNDVGVNYIFVRKGTDVYGYKFGEYNCNGYGLFVADKPITTQNSTFQPIKVHSKKIQFNEFAKCAEKLQIMRGIQLSVSNHYDIK